MKRIVFTIATLALSAGAAFAATPLQPAHAPKATPHHMTAMRNDASANRMTKALNLLEAQGYGVFSNFKAEGKDYAATVTRTGHTETLRVDPDSGQVTIQS
jgi:hypothetical protein